MASRETWITGGVLFTQDPRRRVLRANLRIVHDPEPGDASSRRSRRGQTGSANSALAASSPRGGARIAAITRAAPPRASAGRPIKIIDARGLTILPGFVQAHVHLCQTLFRNQADDLELLDWLRERIWKMEAAHTYATLKTSACLGIHELLSSGTTCVLDMGTVRHTDAIFEAVRDTGIRASVGKCLMDHPQGAPRGLRENTDRALAEACALHDRWHGRESDRIRASFAPRFVISCTEKLLTGVAREAAARGALVHTHASENRGEIAVVRQRARRENIEYLRDLGLASPAVVLAHCVWLSAREKAILARTGTHVTHCPSSNLKLASGIADIPGLRALGVNVALGADGAACNNNLDMFREMRLAALIHKPGHGPRAMRAQEVLDMATLGGARALGWSDDIGSIEIGKKADLIALDLNALPSRVPARQAADPSAIASSIVYATQSAQLRWTMVDAEVLYRAGRGVTGLEAAALARESDRALAAVRRRL